MNTTINTTANNTSTCIEMVQALGVAAIRYYLRISAGD